MVERKNTGWPLQLLFLGSRCCTLFLFGSAEPSREFPGQKNAFQTARFPLDWGGADHRYSHFGCLWFRKWRLGKFCSTVANQPFYPCDELDFTFLPIVSSTWEMTWSGSENFQLFWLTALIPLGPLIYLCVSTSISSWCRNTQHFSTSLKLEAKNRQNYGQENCIVVAGRIYYLCLAAGSSASPTGNIDVLRTY